MLIYLTLLNDFKSVLRLFPDNKVDPQGPYTSTKAPIYKFLRKLENNPSGYTLMMISKDPLDPGRFMGV